MAEKWDSKRVLRLIGRAVLLLLIAIGVINIVAYWWLSREFKQTGNTDTQAVETPPPQVPTESKSSQKDWHEVSRAKLNIGAFDVSEWRGWTWPETQKSENFRVFIEGQFVCYPEDGVVLAEMDETNYERFQSGYPPIVIRTFSCGNLVHAERPDAGFALVFVRKRQASSAASTNIPQSVGELLLLLLQSAQQGQLLPAKVTAELDWVVYYYGTASEATGIRRGLRQQ